MGEKIRQRALRRLLRITLPDGKVLCYKRYNKNQYSEIIRAIFSVFCCGGDCMSQEFPVQIPRCACQVDQDGKTIQTQHLLRKAIRLDLGAWID